MMRTLFALVAGTAIAAAAHAQGPASVLPALGPLSAVTMQRLRLYAARNEGFVATVSARALMRLEPIFLSFAHDGTKPHRTSLNVSGDSSSTTGTRCVGAMLNRGRNFPPRRTLFNSAKRSALESRNRPHTPQMTAQARGSVDSQSAVLPLGSTVSMRELTRL